MKNTQSQTGGKTMKAVVIFVDRDAGRVDVEVRGRQYGLDLTRSSVGLADLHRGDRVDVERRTNSPYLYLVEEER